MEDIMKGLAADAPGIVGVIVVVILFLKAQERMLKIVSSLTDKIQQMEKVLVQHDQWERGKWEEIQKALGKMDRQKTKPRSKRAAP